MQYKQVLVLLYISSRPWNRLDVDVVLAGSGDLREITRVPYSRTLGSSGDMLLDWTVLVGLSVLWASGYHWR